jgi:chlorite dismutase
VDVLVEWILIAAADHADDWLDIIEELRNIIIRAEKFIATYRYIDFALNRPFDRYAPSG